MNTSSTRWLLLFAVGLGAVILLYERPGESTSESAARRSRVLPLLLPDDVSAVTVQRDTNLTLRLERTNGGWEFLAPIRYPAQPAGVGGLLEGLAKLEVRGVLSAAEVLAQTNGLRVFGLDPPNATVVLNQGSSRMELRLGISTLLGSEVYAQVVGQDGLVTVDRGLMALLPYSVHQWRDAGVACMAGLRFNRIEVRPITSGFEVVRNPTNQQWEMTRPLLTRANNAKIESLLERLDLIRALSFVADDPRADLEPYGLQPPNHELVLGQGTNDLVVLQFGRGPTNAPDQLFVRRMANSNVVLVARAAVEPWLGGFRDFCDRRLVVFDPDRVARIVARDEEQFVVERQGSREWRLTAPYAASADHLLVIEMLASLAELEFLEFEREVTTDFAAYGLAPPRRQYRLETTVTNIDGTVTNAILAQVDIGDPTKHKFYARRGSENSVVTMLDTGRLPRAAYELRDRRIWEFTTNQIASITIRQFNNTRRLLRTGPAQWVAAPDTPQSPINAFALEEAAYQLGTLHAARWVARGEDQLARYGFGSIDHQISVELIGEEKQRTHVVGFGRQTLSGRTAYATVNIEGEPAPVIFECRPRLYELLQSELSAMPAPSGASR